MDELEQEFRGWRSHGMAQLFFQAMARKRDMEAQAILSGGTLESQTLTAQKIGFVQGLDWVLNTCTPDSPETDGETAVYLNHGRQS